MVKVVLLSNNELNYTSIHFGFLDDNAKKTKDKDKDKCIINFCKDKKM